MLIAIEGAVKTKTTQDKLLKALKSQFFKSGNRTFGHQGGSVSEKVYYSHIDSLYYMPSHFLGKGTQKRERYANVFGVFKESGSLTAILEINVDSLGVGGRTTGCFAECSNTGRIYLMHTGGVGGGQTGIGRTNFLSYLGGECVPVQTSNGPKQYLQIASLDDPGLASLIWRYVQKVDSFKKLKGTTGAGNISAAATTPNGADSKYSPEYIGRKHGRTKGEFDYQTYHGLVVDTLKADLEDGAVEKEVCNSLLIDLYVEREWTTI